MIPGDASTIGQHDFGRAGGRSVAIVSFPSRLALALTATVLVLAALPASGFAACTNPVACENEKPGSPPSAWQVSGDGDASIQGYATTMSVNRGGRSASRSRRPRAPTTSTSTGWATTRATARACRRRTSGRRRACRRRQPACLTDGGDRPDRLRQLGRLGVVGRAGRRRSRASTSRASCATTPAARARSRSSCATTPASSDMLVRTSDATWQAYNPYGGNSLYSCTVACPPGNPRALQGRVLGLLQPAVRRHDRAGQRAVVPVLRRVPDDPLRRAQRLRRRATRARPTSTPTPRCCATTS